MIAATNEFELGLAAGAQRGTWFALLFAWAVSAAWVGTFVLSGEEAVKVRDALIYRIGEPSDFSWHPANTPPTFLVNRSAPPTRLLQAVREVRDRFSRDGSNGPVTAEAFAWARSVSTALAQAPRQIGMPIQADTMTAYDAITTSGRGYCADFTQVFLGMAFAAGVEAREWGVSFQGFGAGHTFNEVYDTGLDKWVLIDPFHSIYFIDVDTKLPLSVVELHERLVQEDRAERVDVVKIAPSMFPFRSSDAALDYYRRGMTQLALVWGNNVLDYDAAMPVRIGAALGRSVEQVAAILTGWAPRSVIYPIAMSDRDYRQLRRTFWSFAAAALCLVLATLALVALAAVGMRRTRRRSHGV